MSKKFFSLLCALLLMCTVFVACSDKDNINDVTASKNPKVTDSPDIGENADNIIDDAGDGVSDVIDEGSDAIRKGTDAAGEVVEDGVDTVEDGANNAKDNITKDNK